MRHLLGFIVLILFSFSSCQDKKKNNDLTSAKDNALAEVVFLDVYKQAQQYLGVYLEKRNPSDTAIKIYSTTNQNNIIFPFTLTIYYGNNDHLCDDNKYRRGSLKLYVTAVNADTTIYSVKSSSVIFDNYYLNQSKLMGTLDITNNGLNTSNKHNFDIDVSNGFIINANGTISWNSTKTITQTAGESTPNDLSDDNYLLSGSAAGKDSKGTDFSENIATDCGIDPNCRWFIKTGKISVQPYNQEVRNCDYGTGGCTGQVKVQIKEESFNFSIQ